MVVVREMKLEDLDLVASVHKAAFPRQLDSLEWIKCNFNAYPRIQIFVLESDNEIIGFIEWIQKSGFRKEVVAELEQLAISPLQQGKGFGKTLIKQSLSLFSEQLKTREAKLKHILVTTRADNFAQNLYKTTLNANIEHTIANLYSADEVLMIARNVLDS